MHWHVYDDTYTGNQARPILVGTYRDYVETMDEAIIYACSKRLGKPVVTRSHPKQAYRQATIFFGSPDNYGRAILVNECGPSSCIPCPTEE